LASRLLLQGLDDRSQLRRPLDEVNPAALAAVAEGVELGCWNRCQARRVALSQSEEEHPELEEPPNSPASGSKVLHDQAVDTAAAAAAAAVAAAVAAIVAAADVAAAVAAVAAAVAVALGESEAECNDPDAVVATVPAAAAEAEEAVAAVAALVAYPGLHRVAIEFVADHMRPGDTAEAARTASASGADRNVAASHAEPMFLKTLLNSVAPLQAHRPHHLGSRPRS